APDAPSGHVDRSAGLPQDGGDSAPGTPACPSDDRYRTSQVGWVPAPAPHRLNDPEPAPGAAAGATSHRPADVRALPPGPSQPGAGHLAGPFDPGAVGGGPRPR